MRTIDDADIVVVGTGAGGATAALSLQQQGFSVLLLEEGPDLRHRLTEPSTRAAMTRRFRDFGAQVTAGPEQIPLIQGRMVGGSTGINSAIFWRLPDPIWDEWRAQDRGLAERLPRAVVDAAHDAVERDLHVHAVDPAVAGPNNRLLEAGATKLGLTGRTIRRAELGCEGTGRCIVGCPRGRRQGMEVSYIPQALALGARLRADTQVLRVQVTGGRATGVEVRDPGGRGLIRARRGVVLAAGAVHTPWLLLRSGVQGFAGQQFTAHPGFGLLAVFDTPVAKLAGATQGYEVTGLRQHGVKIEALGMPPAITSARLPGAGAAFGRLAAQLDNVASWGCLVRPRQMGTVRRGLFGQPSVRIPLTAEDGGRALLGLQAMVRMAFAAGAREVVTGVPTLPGALTSPGPSDALTTLDLLGMSMVATHLFGGAVMGTDPQRSVVEPDHFGVRGVPGLFVADASLLPGSLGVNPQGTIMAVARVAAERLGDHVRHLAA